MSEWQDKTVVGVSFEGRADILRAMVRNEPVGEHGWQIKKVNCILRAEEDNKYDPFAVGVWIANWVDSKDDKKVGYIPKGNEAIYSHIKLLHPDGLRMAGAIFLKGRYNPTLKLHALAWFQLRRQAGDLHGQRML